MNAKERNKKILENRITEIDFLRGICVFLMIIDHAFYDVFGVLPSVFEDFPYKNDFSRKLYEFAVGYWSWLPRNVVRFAVLAVFLTLTGICCSFSRSNLKRGLKLAGVALLVSVATAISAKLTGSGEC